MSEPIGFQLAGDAIYITTNTTLNKLVLTLTNQSGASMPLKGGTPVLEAQIQPSSPTTVYLSFGTLLKQDEVQLFSIRAPGWSAYDIGNGNWALCPSADLTLADQGIVTFTITNMRVSGQPGSGQLSLDYYNFSGVADNADQIQVFLRNPPDGPIDLELDYGFTDNRSIVYTTLDATSPIVNTLYFGMSNPSQTNPVVTEPWGPNSPAFKITFKFSEPPGYGALTTPEYGVHMDIDVAGAFAQNWKIKKNSDADASDPDSIWWALAPTPANPNVFAAGASVELVVKNLITDLPVGSAPDQTNVYVQYSDLPGYKDGNFAVQMVKESGPEIMNFYCDPLDLRQQQSAPVTLYWATNCSTVAFAGGGIGSGSYQGTGTIAAAMTANEGIALTAYLNQVGVFPSVSRTLRSASVSRQSVALPFASGGAFMVVVPNSSKAYAFGYGSSFAAVDLTTNQISPLDMGSAIEPSYGTGFHPMYVTRSPDARTIYVLLQMAQDPFKFLLMTIKTADNTITMVRDLGVFDQGHLCSMAAAPDGASLYIAFMDLGQSSGPHEGLWTVDTTRFEVLKQYRYPTSGDFREPILMWISSDVVGVKVLVASEFSVTILDVGSDLTVVAQLVVNDVLPNWNIVPFPFAASSDGRRAYMFAASGDSCALLALDIDPASYAISIAAQIPVGGSGPLALGPGDRRLYYASTDQITVYDTATFDPATIACGANGDFHAQALAVKPGSENVFCANTQHDFITLTMSPWPWTSSPSARRA